MKTLQVNIAAIIVAACSFSVLSADYQSHQLLDGKLVIKTDEGALSLTALNTQAIETHYQPSGVKQLPSFAIARTPSSVTAHVTQTDEAVTFSAGDISAVIDKRPVRISYFYQGKPIAKEEVGFFHTETLSGFRFTLNDDEKLLGAGQRVLGMDRRGHRLPLYNRAHYGYETKSEQMYFSVPAVMSSNRYSIMFDNSASGHVDLGATEKDVLQFEAVAGRTSYIVSGAKSYAELVKLHSQVTGYQPLPNRWTLGNFASRFGYRTQAEAEMVVDEFIAKGIPLDAIVLDLYWFGKDVKGHMGNLAWDKIAWPNPTEMIKSFRNKGVKTVLISEPFILTTSKRWDDAVASKALATNLAGEPKTFDFYFGNTGLIDLFSPQGQAWLGDIYQELAEQGVAGWWGDLGEPEVHPGDTQHAIGTADEIHNAYGHQWAKMVADFEAKHRPEQRPFIMMRAGFLGSQRYGMVPWTGDVSRSWGGLKPQVELALQMGLWGFGYIHSDLGGFAGGDKFDAELYTRWMQYGVFQPVYRPHGQDNIAPEPIFHDEKTQAIIKRFIQLRYQMLPYNYTLSYEHSTSGMPLMRPLAFEFDDMEMLDNKDSYLWGDSFLVTPVVEPGIKSVKVNLPKGVWFDYFSGQRFLGGKVITQATDINTLPVLIKAGAFIPMVDVVQSSDDYSSKQLTLHHYVDSSVSSATGKMFEDDGNSVDSLATGAYRLFQFSAKRTDSAYLIAIGSTGKGYQSEPAQRQLSIVIHHQQQRPARVLVDGEAVKFVYHSEDQELTFELMLSADNTQVEIQGK
ncbi:TIM-barrel domain-containing protein [Shewanella sp. UCD-KL12]|uniref:glycoside hydrolase family 31 protein n=1 Tax=Shewanella sp. UCD-KL12 TaxID=1917163 RepID=UPI000970F346|nr:TIM-barrel domain-containing protein [Shewanella sp. UCD-KL12]